MNDKRENRTAQAEPARQGRTYIPSVDIIETPEELLLVADVPGASADGIEVQYENGQLNLHARVNPRQKPETQFLAREYGCGDFYRSFTVGEGIDAGKIEAEVTAGVLTLHLPKGAAAKTRKIAVKSA